MKCQELIGVGTLVQVPLGRKLRLLAVFAIVAGTAEQELIALRIQAEGQLLGIIGLNPCGNIVATACTWARGLSATQTFQDPAIPTSISSDRLTAALPDVDFEGDLLISIEFSAAGTVFSGVVWYEWI